MRVGSRLSGLEEAELLAEGGNNSGAGLGKGHQGLVQCDEGFRFRERLGRGIIPVAEPDGVGGVHGYCFSSTGFVL